MELYQDPAIDRPVLNSFPNELPNRPGEARILNSPVPRASPVSDADQNDAGEVEGDRFAQFGSRESVQNAYAEHSKSGSDADVAVNVSAQAAVTTANMACDMGGCLGLSAAPNRLTPWNPPDVSKSNSAVL